MPSARSLIDDAILLLASHLNASFDADLRSVCFEDESGSSGEESAGEPDILKESLQDKDANDVELQRLRWDAVARGVASAVRCQAALFAQERGLSDSRGSQVESHAAIRAGRLELAFDLTGPQCQQRGRYLIWKAAKDAQQAVDSGRKSSKFNVALGDSIGKRIDAIMAEAARNLPSAQLETDDGHDDDESPIEIYQPPVSHQLSDEDLAARTALAQAEDEFMQRVQQLQTDFFGKHKKWMEVDVAQMLPGESGNAPFRSSTRNVASSQVEPKSTHRTPAGNAVAAHGSAARVAVQQVYTAVRGNNNVTELARQAVLGASSADPLAALRRAANPGASRRPPRPSQVADDECEYVAHESDDDAALTAAYVQKTLAPVPAGTPAHRDPQAADLKQPPAAAAGAQRAGRWTIVEYDEDEDDDGEDE